MSGSLLVLDYGGTKLSAGLVDRRSRGPQQGDSWLALERVQKPAGADGAYDRRTMVELAERLLAGRTPAAIGVSFGGPVAFERGVVRLSHHVPGWEGVELGTQLSQVFAAPCRIDNDANAGALGEHRYGAGRGVDSLLYVTVSTGVGGGWLLGGEVWRGFEGMAGEFGHVTVDPEGPTCVCGGRGCVESLAAGPRMAAAAAEMLARRPEAGTILREVAGIEPLSAVHLGAAAARGDDIALTALATGAQALGVALGSTANLVNPRRFVIGGGVVKAGEPFWGVLLRTAREHTMPEVSLDIVKAELGDDAPLWGAVALAEDAIREREPVS